MEALNAWPVAIQPGSLPMGDTGVAGLERLAAKAGRGEQLSADERRQVAQSFEALMLKRLLEHTTSSMLSEGMFGSGPGSDYYQDTFCDQMAQLMARSGGIGLAAELEAQLAREPVSPPEDASTQFISLEKQARWQPLNSASQARPLPSHNAYQALPERPADWQPLRAGARYSGGAA